MSGRRRTRTQKRRAGQPRTLRARLVVASVVLIATVCAVIGTVTTLALRSHLYDQLHGQLREAAARVSGDFAPPGVGKAGGPPGQGNQQGQIQKKTDLGDFVTHGPQPSGTIAAKVVNDAVTSGKVGKKSSSTFEMSAEDLTDAQKTALGEVSQDALRVGGDDDPPRVVDTAGQRGGLRAAVGPAGEVEGAVAGATKSSSSSSKTRVLDAMFGAMASA